MVLRTNDAVVGALRDAGFSLELSYGTLLAVDSYTYGFTLQESAAPREPTSPREGAATLSRADYPHLVEMMDFLTARATADDGAGTTDFELGLGLFLDGLERARSR